LFSFNAHLAPLYLAKSTRLKSKRSWNKHIEQQLCQ
jgi:hypothetical protein